MCDGVVLQQRVDCFASVLSALSHLCVFMQLSLRSVWRWMAIAAPLATALWGICDMAGGLEAAMVWAACVKLAICVRSG